MPENSIFKIISYTFDSHLPRSSSNLAPTPLLKKKPDKKNSYIESPQRLEAVGCKESRREKKPIINSIMESLM